MKHDYEMGRTIAAIYDTTARARGCSSFERGLRDRLGVATYDNDPDKREFAILMEVIKHNRREWE